MAGSLRDMDYLQTVGIWVGTIAGLVAALSIILKSPIGRLVRWLWSRNVADPYWKAHRAQTARVVDEKLLARNGGTTVPDAIAAIEKLGYKTDAQHRANSRRLDVIEHHLSIPHQGA